MEKIELEESINKIEERQLKLLKVLYQVCLDDSASDTPWSLLVWNLMKEIKNKKIQPKNTKKELSESECNTIKKIRRHNIDPNDFVQPKEKESPIDSPVPEEEELIRCDDCILYNPNPVDCQNCNTPNTVNFHKKK